MDLTAWPSPLFSLGSSLPCPLRSIDSRVTEERGEEQTRKREEVSDGGTGWVSDQVTRKDGCGTKGRNRKGMVWERSDPSPEIIDEKEKGRELTGDINLALAAPRI